jgi:hypothetical protein
MTLRRSTAVALAALAWAVVPTGVATGATSTVRLAILHVVHGCHVWNSTKTAKATVTLPVGGRLVIRPSCPMDFDFRQVAGPKLALGDPRTYAGTARVIVFKKPGTYRLVAKNVQTPAEVGLETLGTNDTLRLTIVVPRS